MYSLYLALPYTLVDVPAVICTLYILPSLTQIVDVPVMICTLYILPSLTQIVMYLR